MTNIVTLYYYCEECLNVLTKKHKVFCIKKKGVPDDENYFFEKDRMCSGCRKLNATQLIDFVK